MIHIKIEKNSLAQVLKEIDMSLSYLSKKQHYKALLICEEVITNQIRHAEYEHENMLIELDIFKLAEDEVEFIFKDNSKEFNPLQHVQPKPSNSLAEQNLGGLGIFMVKKYAKNISYDYNNNFNILKVSL